ncbi:MAG TPA: LamG-like jellyroll fold domain-containing protein [Candidatus Polarisedimenticolaceae bacterium]|nr:LamG-like jellyroll fold domain-containing protein [Candidatus Polarisedimenticolaceae bacterium]
MPNRTAMARIAICSILSLPWAPTASWSQQCVDVPSGLIGWWPGDGSGEDLARGVDGALLGEVGFGDGVVGQAFVFDGIDAGIEVTNADGAFDLVEAWTVDAWVFPAADGQDARLDPIVWKIGAPNTNNDTFDLGWGCHDCAGRNRFQTSTERASDGQDFVVTSAEHPAASWYHIAAVYDGINLLLYVDAVEEGRALIGQVTAYTGPAPLRIGNILHTSHSPRGVFDGRIDEVEIFDRALTPDEIRAIHQAGPAGKCKSHDDDGDGFTAPVDCDDEDAAVHPDAAELPGNRLDENCDGLVSCDPCESWRNHGHYVSCVAREVAVLVDEGRIDAEHGEELVSTAARSEVGKRVGAPDECSLARVQAAVATRRGRFGAVHPPSAPRPRHVLQTDADVSAGSFERGK